ncbi:hypothetical protein BBR47_05230 [Brevibacillus brevis NBRC 100599]|uniref:Uncharacterized protein n=2 Tax=Brevibacillus TaxID=55080 RepID=C0ZK49_BREBN|nr:hypothetical protein BBR47_05230 [Brevibacillus brevis NBRC 100599]
MAIPDCLSQAIKRTRSVGTRIRQFGNKRTRSITSMRKVFCPEWQRAFLVFRQKLRNTKDVMIREVLNMWRLIVCLALLFSGSTANAAGLGEPIELFDTDKQRVVASFENTTGFQEEAKQILQSVSGRVLEFNPSLDSAMIVKIPLVPPKPIKLKSANLDAMIAEMFVIMPKKGERRPWLILHTKEYETVVVEFIEKVDDLRKQVKLP